MNLGPLFEKKLISNMIKLTEKEMQNTCRPSKSESIILEDGSDFLKILELLCAMMEKQKIIYSEN